MATGSFQVIMKSIATTGIWPWLQLAAVVIGGKNGAEILHTRIRPFGVRRNKILSKALYEIAWQKLQIVILSIYILWLPLSPYRLAASVGSNSNPQANSAIVQFKLRW
jgi:hypothetical protein